MRITYRIVRSVFLSGLFALPLAVQAAPAPNAITPDGGSYYGPLLNGKLHGQGRIEWPNGRRYSGGFERGLFNGQARFILASGEVYEGALKDGLFDGRGRLTLLDATYVGGFEKNAFSGQGEITYSDGRKYRGEWKENHMNGQGRMELADGQVYEGTFVQDQFTGEGKHTAANGTTHEGRFEKWRPNGPGRYVDTFGNTFEGNFVNGEPRGPFKVTSQKNQSSYEGELRGWRPHGNGVLRLANGDVYRGSFENGAYHGEGTLTRAGATADAPKVEKGTWRYGRLRDPAAERAALENVEKALYGQRALLDKALAAIAPREPGKINLYLLAVGGDGSQEVFRREVEFVRGQFDERFGTRTRAVSLVNSRNTVDTQPMATLSSIRESLNAIAGRMDKAQDILFVFLTSHGSEQHELSLNQNNIRLRDLPAKELGSMLKETGIRWKVVVISACYSGGFIDAIRDDHTLVITASRADRRSFGCADENDFTYFGRAYFQQALPASTSFREAFTKAEALIRERERTEMKDAPESELSLPQIAGSEQIDEQVRRWWGQR